MNDVTAFKLSSPVVKHKQNADKYLQYVSYVEMTYGKNFLTCTDTIKTNSKMKVNNKYGIT